MNRVLIWSENMTLASTPGFRRNFWKEIMMIRCVPHSSKHINSVLRFVFEFDWVILVYRYFYRYWNTQQSFFQKAMKEHNIDLLEVQRDFLGTENEQNTPDKWSLLYYWIPILNKEVIYLHIQLVPRISAENSSVKNNYSVLSMVLFEIIYWKILIITVLEK